MITVPVLKFVPSRPANLGEVLEAQARRLIEIGVPKEVGVEEGKFLDDAMRVASEFVYSVKLARQAHLDRVWLMHYGVPDQHLAKAGGVAMMIGPESYTLFGGATLPDGFQVVQGQLGPKYKDRSPRDIRLNHDAFEQLGVPKEGLTAFLYWGEDLFRESNMQFPGANIDYNGAEIGIVFTMNGSTSGVPRLNMRRLYPDSINRRVWPELFEDNDHRNMSGYGSVTVSRER